MLKFEAISLEKMDQYLDIKKRSHNKNADDSFFFMWAWKELYNYEWAFSGNMCWVRYYYDGKIYYKIPIGIWKQKNWINLFARKLPPHSELRNVSEDFALRLLRKDNDHFTFREDPDTMEYIYKRQDITELPGKKFHVKRQHVNFFEKIYEYEQKEIEEDDIKDIQMLFQFEQRQTLGDYDPEFSEEEYIALNRILKNWKIFKPHLIGKILIVQNQPVSFIIGEKQNNNNLQILFEKSLSNVKGAGPTNCKLFAQAYPEAKYINWGQDFGQAELRRLRCSNKPCGFIKKFNAKIA